MDEVEFTAENLIETWNTSNNYFKNNKQLERSLYQFYKENYSDDKDGLSSFKIKEATFYDLLDYLISEEKDVYSLFSDSTIRERLFLELASILKTDYNVIYDIWLES